MRKLVATIAMACVLALPAFAGPTWTRATPGGGGAFLTADVAADGTVLVGSDLSGAYCRAGTGDWTHVGARDGLEATSIEVVRWKPGQSAIALAGTRNGMFRTPAPRPGRPWIKVTEFGHEVVTAIAWQGDRVYAASGGNASTPLVLRVSTDGAGRSWSPISHDLPAGLRAVKMIADPVRAGIVWLLSGDDRFFQGRKELWRSTNGGVSWTLVSVQSGRHLHAIDFALHPASSGVVLMATSLTGPAGGKDDRGVVYRSANGGATWAAVSALPAQATGAVWFDGRDAYLVNVQADACGDAGLPRSGKFKSADEGVTWTKVDDGVGSDAWDVGWTRCSFARGRALATVARTLSAKGEYWVTTQFVWRYTSAPPFKYENAFTSRVGSSPGSWITRGIDNSVPTAFTSAGPGHYWAGYYDIGIWSTHDGGASWANRNPVIGTWKGQGGNVTGIVVAENSAIVATMAPSSKVEPDSGNVYLYSVWRSTDGGDTWSICRAGLPHTGFLYGLSRDPGTGRLWLTRDGRVYASSDAGLSWNPASGRLPATGLYVTQAKDGVVLAGGTGGLYRSRGPRYDTWTPVENGAFDFSGDPGEVADPKNPDVPTLHKKRWHGIQQILFDPQIANRVWVVSYYGYGKRKSGPGKRVGVWKSDDLGLTFTPITTATLRRGVAVDSLGRRLHITSGVATTGGCNDEREIAAAEGKETWRDDGSGTFKARSIDTDHPDYQYPFGGPIDIPEDGRVFVGVPGYGFMRQDLSPAPAAVGAKRLTR